MLIKKLSTQDFLFLFTTLALPLAYMMSQAPIFQNPSYHNFADQSLIGGIPHFFDVATNVLFLLAGIYGVREHLRNKFSISKLGLVLGVILVAPGSAYYHLQPDNERLLWDRLPMVIGFCSLMSWLLVAYFKIKREKLLLSIINIIGLSSLIVWVWTGDLRFYYWVQLSPVVLLLYLGIFKGELFTNRAMILGAFVCYAAAKLTEKYDIAIFESLGVSGHSVKHALAALAVLLLVKLDVRPSLTTSHNY